MGRHRGLGRMGPSLAFTQAMVGHRRSHPSADSQTQAPAREPDTSKRARGSLQPKPFSSGYRNAIPCHHHKLHLGMHSQLHLLPYTCSANSRGPIILGSSCACRRGQDKALGSRQRSRGGPCRTTAGLSMSTSRHSLCISNSNNGRGKGSSVGGKTGRRQQASGQGTKESRPGYLPTHTTTGNRRGLNPSQKTRPHPTRDCLKHYSL